MGELRIALIMIVFFCAALSPWAVTAQTNATETADAVATKELSKKEQRKQRRIELQKKVDALLQREPEQEDYGAEERCISSSRIRSMEALDNQHVAIRLNRNEHYLIQFEKHCPGMRRGQTVLFESRGNRLCAHDAIRTVEDFGFAGLQPGMKCFIPGFQSVSKEQLDGIKALLKNRSRRS